MSPTRVVCWLASVLILICTASVSIAETVEPTGSRARIAVAQPGLSPEPVPRWDAGSPQDLVRIDGRLYQKDTGFYYRAVEDLITVRLAGSVRDWDELLDRATAAAPQTFELLEVLVPERANRLGIIDLRTPPGADLAAWCELIHETGLVRYAEISTYGVYLTTPNDPQYSQQWALNNTGQTGGSADADIDAPEAWDLTGGDPSVIVGVLDSGTNVDHPDLAPNVWHNPGEIAGNAVDDDGNGFIDDWEGWDFGSGNNDPRSSNYHGSHVTGIINAASDNGIGVAGLAGGLGGPGAQSMAVAVGESGPVGGILDDALIYAADNGAVVITMSLSVGASSAINDALDYAYNTKDVFIDCAAGNNGSSVAYPANRAEVMSVASTDHNDNRSSFSNPGPENEIAAPGSNILSTQLGTSYGSSSGTSFAAPYVGALAALIRGMNPGLPAPEVRQLIIDTAEDVEAPGFDNLTGWGRINAFLAVSQTATSDGDVRLNGATYSCDDTVTVTVNDIDLAGSGTISIVVNSDTEAVGESVSLSETGGGSGVFRGMLTTAFGSPSADGVLQVDDGDVLTADYLDADDGLGGTGVLKSAVADVDCRAPLISGVNPTDIDDASARITWTTDEAGTSLVRYGNFPPPAEEVSSSVLTTSHSLTLNGLESCTIYRFEIETTDDLGNSGLDDNAGSFYTFETFGNFPGSGVVPCHQGQAALDKATYGCSDTVRVSVTDVDLGIDPLAAETIQVQVTSTSEPGGEWITLTEIALESNRFEGEIDLDPASVASDGTLAAAAADLITVTYQDEDDGEGQPRFETSNSVADCLGPKIENVRVTAVTSTRADIEWSTDEPASSRVEFGADDSLGSVVEDLGLKTTHRLTVSAFTACGDVFFRVEGADANGDVLSAGVGGAPFRFNMNEIGGLLFHDNFEDDDGWILGGEFERDIPQGLGSANGDPDVAYSGSGIIGTDLSGTGTFAGDYEPQGKSYAFSPSIDASGSTNLELILRRRLGVTTSDEASISILAPSMMPLWSNTGSINDSQWTEVRYDISAQADNQPAVRLNFQVESEDAGQSFGWNIDEVVVKDSTQPDYRICGGCAGAPSFGGIVAAYDPAPCGASGITLQWEAAPAWGTGSGGSYDVHRGTSAGFLPTSGNRIVSGLTATTWTDTGAPLDTPVWYVVRARNDESCTGGEGLADGNTVELPAMETVSLAAPGSPGQSVRVDRVGGAHVRLSWDPVPGADHYVVRRSTSPDFSGAVTVGSTAATFLENIDAAADPNFYTYRVFAANACGEETP